MSDLNRVVLVGRLAQDPELRSTDSGVPVCRFTLASTRYLKDQGEKGGKREEVGYYECVAFGRTAESIYRYLTKGRRIGVDGSLRYNSWTTPEGKKNKKIQIQVENFMFLDSYRESSLSPQSPIKDALDEDNTDVIPAGEKLNVPEPIDTDYDDDVPF